MASAARVPRRALFALAGAGVACGLVFAWLTLASGHLEERGLEAALGLLFGWAFIATGLFAWWRRPEI